MTKSRAQCEGTAMWSTAEVKDGKGGRGRSASGDVSVEEDCATSSCPLQQ